MKTAMTIREICDHILSVPWSEEQKSAARAALDADSKRYHAERDARLIAMSCSRRVN